MASHDIICAFHIFFETVPQTNPHYSQSQKLISLLPFSSLLSLCGESDKFIRHRDITSPHKTPVFLCQKLLLLHNANSQSASWVIIICTPIFYEPLELPTQYYSPEIIARKRISIAAALNYGIIVLCYTSGAAFDHVIP